MSQPTTLLWELDFYSRPIVDENSKRIWELLICTPDRSFTWVKECPSNEVNSGWLSQALGEAMAVSGYVPLKVRFFRNSMGNIITRGCKQAGVTPQSSRRLFAMANWLDQRMTTVYPQHPTFQSADPTPLPLQPAGQIVPQTLPDALCADRWQMLRLPVAELANAPAWEKDFGEFFPVDLAPELEIPGVMMQSQRALPLAAWMSGVDPVFLKFWSSLSDRMQLRLDAGADASWIVANLTGDESQDGQRFEAEKKAAQGIHFLAIQAHSDSDRFAGFWLLKEV